MNAPIAPSGAFRVSFTDLPDLAAAQFGGKALSTSDDFFAPMSNLLKAEAPVFIPGKYTEFGKWMDGWESRRKREPGHDWCIVQLGMPGVVRGVNVDTAHFLGNFPEYASISACETEMDPAKAQWTEILPKSKLAGGTQNLFAVASDKRWTHLKLEIFPDGGVARLRVHGEVKPSAAQLAKKPLDLAALENGAAVVAANDSFFGSRDNMIAPGRAAVMGEGWETRRKRGDLSVPDWIVVRLAAAGKVEKIEIDTNHFKGNFPESAVLEGCLIREENLVERDFSNVSFATWQEILPRTKLKAHHQHYFESDTLKQGGTYTHVRLKIYPDGGISRLRVWGSPAK